MRGFVDKERCWFDDHTKRPRMRNYAAIADATYEPMVARSCLNCRDQGVCVEHWFDDMDWPERLIGIGCWEPKQTMESSWRMRMEDEKRQASLAGGLERINA